MQQSKTKEIDEILKTVGLSSTESRLYISLLRLGSSTLTPLSRELDLAPTTVQSAIDRLIDRGIISVSKHGSRRLYTAEDPSIFRQIIERQLEEVKMSMPILKELTDITISKNNLKILRGDQIKSIFYTALESKNQEILEIVSAKEFQKNIGEKFHFTRRRIKKRIYLKSLRVKKEEIKKYSALTHKRELREAKFLPRDISFKSSLMIFDDYVAILPTKIEDVAILIESRSISIMFRQIFGILWDISRKMETI
jgi:sugar-specific transcriptional regulator TrmB